jgi:ABC-type transporter Mla MlaB component
MDAFGASIALFRCVLRITIQNTSTVILLKLEGSVKGPWVEELQKAWLTSAIMSDGQPASVDLAGVSFVDSRGRELLLRMQKEGVVLKGASGFLREMLEDGSGKHTILTKDRSSQ